MFVTGCERGSVLCWDAATGARLDDRLPGATEDTADLAVADLPDGRQLLIGIDSGTLYRWQSGRPDAIATWSTDQLVRAGL